MFVIIRMKTRELKHQDADIRADGLAWLEECAAEQIGVQEVLVGAACADAERGRGCGNFLTVISSVTLRPNWKSGGTFSSQAREIFFARKRIVGGIHAHRFEHLGVFAQARFLKPRLRHFAAIFVARGRVKLPKPSVIFPRGRSDEIRPLASEFRRRLFHLLSVRSTQQGRMPDCLTRCKRRRPIRWAR